MIAVDCHDGVRVVLVVVRVHPIYDLRWKHKDRGDVRGVRKQLVLRRATLNTHVGLDPGQCEVGFLVGVPQREIDILWADGVKLPNTLNVDLQLGGGRSAMEWFASKGTEVYDIVFPRPLAPRVKDVAQEYPSSGVTFKLGRLPGGYRARLKEHTAPKRYGHACKVRTMLAVVRRGIVDRARREREAEVTGCVRPEGARQARVDEVCLRAVDNDLHASLGKCVGGGNT